MAINVKKGCFSHFYGPPDPKSILAMLEFYAHFEIFEENWLRNKLVYQFLMATNVKKMGVFLFLTAPQTQNKNSGLVRARAFAIHILFFYTFLRGHRRKSVEKRNEYVHAK